MTVKLVLSSIACFVLIATLTLAISNGQVISQAQLDSVNLSEYDWRDLNCYDLQRTWIQNGWIHSDFSCLNLKDYNGTHYIAYEEEQSTNTPVRAMKQCVQRRGLQPCIDAYRRVVTRKALNIVDTILENIKRLQTDQFEDEIRSWNVSVFG